MGQTARGLYLTSPEAAAIKADQGDKVLFVDVRDPIEILFTGVAGVLDVDGPLRDPAPGASPASAENFCSPGGWW